MSPKTFSGFRIDDAILEVMQAVKNERGIPLSTQVEFALRDWLERQGFAVPAGTTPGRSPRRVGR